MRSSEEKWATLAFGITLCDIDPELLSAWRTRFKYRWMSIQYGDFFKIDADAYVSPANSFGIMDGGFDLLLSNRFPGVEGRVRQAIDLLGGTLPVGEAIIVDTWDVDGVPFLVSAPTMRVPSNIAGTNNVFLAMRGLLRAVHRFNLETPEAIKMLAIPGLGTGVGRMPPTEAAQQMWDGLEAFLSEL